MSTGEEERDSGWDISLWPRYTLTKTRDTEGKGRGVVHAPLRQVSDAIPVFLRQYQLGQVLRVAKPRDALLASQSLWRDSPDGFSCKWSGQLRQARTGWLL